MPMCSRCTQQAPVAYLMQKHSAYCREHVCWEPTAHGLLCAVPAKVSLDCFLIQRSSEYLNVDFLALLSPTGRPARNPRDARRFVVSLV